MKAVPSPLLERLGLLTEEDKSSDAPVVTGIEYVRARVKDVHYKVRVFPIITLSSLISWC